MQIYKIKNTRLKLESRIFHLHKIFYSAAQRFKLFFDSLSPAFTNYRKGEKNAYNVTFLISQLIYLTGISDNEDFQTDKSTLKGYLSKNKNFNWDVYNKFY